MANKYLPDVDHVVRHLSATDFDTDETGNLVVFPHAFELRAGEKYLSAAWLEFFAGPELDRISAVATCFAKRRTVKASHAFALGQVGAVKEACFEYEIKIRVIHEPNDDNPAYVAVRSYKSDNLELLDLLAREAWSRVVNVQPALDRYGPWNQNTIIPL